MVLPSLHRPWNERDRTAERPADRLPERTTKRIPERSFERTPDRNTDRTTERPGNPALARSRAIRVLLVEDHFLARMALHSVLSKHLSIQIVGEAPDGETGLEQFRLLRPDVVVLDLRLPKMSGFEVIARLREQYRARIVVLSNYQGSEDIYRAMQAGATGYLTKDASGEQVIQAIQSAHRGARYLPQVALHRLAERMPSVALTPREAEVLNCVTRGFSNREIAEELGIAEKTVRIHVSAVLEKLGARDRTQATIYALQRGLVHLDHA